MIITQFLINPSIGANVTLPTPELGNTKSIPAKLVHKETMAGDFKSFIIGGEEVFQYVFNFKDVKYSLAVDLEELLESNIDLLFNINIGGGLNINCHSSDGTLKISYIMRGDYCDFSLIVLSAEEFE